MNYMKNIKQIFQIQNGYCLIQFIKILLNNNNKYTFIDYEVIYPLKNVIKKNNQLFIKIIDEYYDKIKPDFYNEYLLKEYFK